MKRNLCYHVYPLSGNGIWQWNVAQLRRRWKYFNGRKVVAVVRGKDCDPPEAVRKEFGDDSIEFLEFDNDPQLGEVVSFRAMLERVKSAHSGHVTLYAHAKGVTHRMDDTRVFRWTEMLYRSLLDDPLLLEAMLYRFPIVGSCKSYRKFQLLRNAPWHYSGSFYWFRHDAVFTRDIWKDGLDHKYATEAWPGFMFPAGLGGCLWMDGVVNMYDEAFWNEAVNDSVRQWQPPDLPPDLRGFQ